MSSMLLKASSNPKYNPIVLDIQNKLNMIKCRVHGNWPSLVVDGLFGVQTKNAVTQFQIYKNIAPVSGQVGDTTLKYINEEYNRIPVLKASNKKPVAENNSTLNLNNLNDFISQKIFGVLKEIDDVAKSQDASLSKYANFSNSKEILSRLVDKHLVGNSSLTSLQGKIKEYWEEQSRNAELSKSAKGNTNVYNYQTGRHKINEVWKISQAQSQLSKSNLFLKQIEKSAKQLYEKCEAEIKRFDIQSKIRKIGEKGPKITSKGSLKGGTVLLAFSFIPIISDFIIWAYNRFILNLDAQAEWNRLINKLISFIEGVLIGALVSAIVAAIGLTGGVAVIVVVVACLIIGLLIALLCPEGSIIQWTINRIKNMMVSPVH